MTPTEGEEQMDTHERVAQSELREGEALVSVQEARAWARMLRDWAADGHVTPTPTEFEILASVYDSAADALAASQRKADEAIQAHTSLTETYKKVARERDDAEDALAASQEKERQLVYVLETIRANARGSERVASSWLIARVDGAFDFTQTHGTSRVALDSTQTHGGSDG